MVNKLIDNKTWNARKVSSNQTEFHVGWVNYLDENDDWQEIDCIVTKTDSDFTVTKAPFNFSAPLYSDGVAFFESDSKFDITTKAKITADNYGLYITARNVTRVEGELFDINGDGRLDAVIYKQAYPDIDADLIYYVKHGKAPRLEKLVRFNSVLSADTDIEFHLRYTDTPAITPSTLDASKDRDDEATANRTKLKNGELISQDNGFYIKPFGVSENRGLGMKNIKIWDSTVTNEDTVRKIETVDTDIKTDGSGYSILTKHIKASFFSGVTYPVYTDATTAFNPDAHVESTSTDNGLWDFNSSVTSGNWNTVHDMSASNRDQGDDYDRLELGHLRTNASSKFLWIRNYILFDTSAINDTHAASAATLSFVLKVAYDRSSAGSSSISPTTNVLVQSSPASSTNIVKDDWDQCGAINDPDEGTDTRFDPYSDWTVDSYNDITLNDTGLSWIDVGGVTKFGIRNTIDALDDYPGTNKHSNHGDVASADASGTSEDPKLTVTHAIPTTFTPKAITMF